MQSRPVGHRYLIELENDLQIMKQWRNEHSNFNDNNSDWRKKTIDIWQIIVQKGPKCLNSYCKAWAKVGLYSFFSTVPFDLSRCKILCTPCMPTCMYEVVTYVCLYVDTWHFCNLDKTGLLGNLMEIILEGTWLFFQYNPLNIDQMAPNIVIMIFLHGYGNAVS